MVYQEMIASGGRKGLEEAMSLAVSKEEKVSVRKDTPVVILTGKDAKKYLAA